jgi:signal peptidase I
MTKTSALEKLKSKKISRLDFQSLKTVLEIKKLMSFTIASGSMEPLIMTGENIVVEPINGDLKKFDIIVFYFGEKLVCHYLLHCNEIPSMKMQKTYVTRGLANGYEDLPCENDELFGRVISHKMSYWTRMRISILDFMRR